jgi:hypothetical protein
MLTLDERFNDARSLAFYLVRLQLSNRH